jgi:hypothetical protein
MYKALIDLPVRFAVEIEGGDMLLHGVGLSGRWADELSN